MFNSQTQYNKNPTKIDKFKRYSKNITNVKSANEALNTNFNKNI